VDRRETILPTPMGYGFAILYFEVSVQLLVLLVEDSALDVVLAVRVALAHPRRRTQQIFADEFLVQRDGAIDRHVEVVDGFVGGARAAGDGWLDQRLSRFPKRAPCAQRIRPFLLSNERQTPFSGYNVCTLA
jgi:hypothetical protein